MQFPVKGSECSHDRAFDFMTFIAQNKNHLESWRCPLCSLTIHRLLYIPFYRYLVTRIE